MNVEKIRRDFPILQKESKIPLVYFDNACMTLRPTQVIDAIKEYYEEYPTCALRSHHKLSKLATDKVEESRKRVQKFIGAKETKEVIFTRNTTEGLNLVANSLRFQKGDVVLTHDKEHNSNLIPWLHMAKKGILKHDVVHTNNDNTFNIETFEERMDRNVKLISMGHASNLDGVKIPAKEIIKIAHDNGAKVLLDAAQSAPHMELNVKKLDVDFLAFSGHKMMGPSGIGALYVNSKNFDDMDTYMLGGETVYDSTYDSFKLEEFPLRYEGGLQNYSGQIGFGAACKYISKIGLSNVAKQEQKVNRILTEGVGDSVELIGPKSYEQRGGIFNFNIKGMDPHIVAGMLDASRNIAVRSGAHCCHSWFNAKKMQGSVRASTYAYNTEEEAEIFVEEMKKLTDL